MKTTYKLPVTHKDEVFPYIKGTEQLNSMAALISHITVHFLLFVHADVKVFRLEFLLFRDMKVVSI